MRTVPSGTAEAAAAEQLSPITLAEFDFASGFVRVWAGFGSMVWDGKTWNGIGFLGSVSRISETIELQAVGVEFELSGIPADVLAIANTESWQGRACKVWFAALDANGALVGEPLQVFSGLMDQMTFEEGSSATLRLAAESKQIDLERANVRRYTAEDQRSEFPGDKGCDVVAALQELEILWGG
jgi:hypothetical protein